MKLGTDEGKTLFTFVLRARPAVLEAGARAARLCTRILRTWLTSTPGAPLEPAMIWADRHNAGLLVACREQFSVGIHERTFKQVVGEAMFSNRRGVSTLGPGALRGEL
jgi:hypothetical protein